MKTKRCTWELERKEADLKAAEASMKATSFAKLLLIALLVVSAVAGTVYLMGALSKSLSMYALCLPLFSLSAFFLYVRSTPTGRGYLWLFGKGKSPSECLYYSLLFNFLLLCFITFLEAG